MGQPKNKQQEMKQMYVYNTSFNPESQSLIYLPEVRYG